jgi:hypothetical protein
LTGACLDEDGDLLDAATIELKWFKMPSGHRVGVTFYSCVRSLRGLLIGLNAMSRLFVGA